ncbi:FAD-dependent oxidoreductase [Streptomyces echinatus]|uniref:2-polyprenyl-6-methoxyphenol hydroxylase-like FAD-dependent oxidoreductase n=1 Tax=Streptomyces echinatus TaxID=67293 RepID=A0A7W9Q0I5_9ACTN|nr:FAD-dependent oxidoreductase [Streptomyces echinatus]MBB5931406.1 2-polyprenyl-6-methoxyphenol hydroxylase-like FAD-dependent oxidoreductase [Streptomyces echinatus]
MRVLVIGGGIAGTATALGLHKAGFDVSVFEAHPDTAEDLGAFLTLASNGMRALAELDATEAVTAVGFPLTSLRLLDGRGTEVTHVPMGETDDPALRYRCLRRGELNAALQDEAVGRGIRLRHGARLVSVADGPDGVTARFADGTTATGDLLLGADGLNSTVRRLLTPGVRPVYAGQRVYYGYAGTPAPGPDGAITMVRGSGTAFGYAVSPAGETYWFARAGGEPLPAGAPPAPPDVLREQLLPLLREDATPAAGLVDGSADAIMVTNATELPLGTPWHTGRVLLVGDSAHAASPATGQGASMALEDAVVLAKALRDLPAPEAAFAEYERHRRPRAEHNITVSGGLSRGTRTPSGPAPVMARPTGPDERLLGQLAWDTPLSAVPSEPH